MNKSTLLFCCISLFASLFAAGNAFADVSITGAGATFPYPIYAKWADTYKSQTDISVNYQSIGSGGGIKQIIAKTVDFGASDMPLKPEYLKKNGLMQFPAVMGGVVPVINIPGIAAGQLKLNGKALADIFQGKITKWNHPTIKALNPGAKLPNKTIIVVHRSDGSGTTFIFTNYLSKVSPGWKSAIGEGTAVSWKTGTGGKGNEGVASYVQRIKNSIGYVEYAYALQNKMAYVQLKNHDGQFVKPNDTSFKSAAANADWKKTSGFYELLTNEPGKESWPITGATFILMHKTQKEPESAKEVLKFFDWAYNNGDKMAEALDYVPMPEKVQQLVRTAWKEQIKDNKGNAIWK
ncbi:phosphate ABC transporter substrate-binding protein PstS [Candidatus Nitrotoga sp. M5]|uniref:phosphate ABC transporter substrate-binding protein PstS n=1 Tax=Candidatus Nitrotoga sp. M5 TaxID=2890409 RepID=UPI001EF49231|nr:phosphate ABC transporter substrate-binding protein PstS [Candidatus Nitrotoga sp. M5]CAH1388087.1 phosphate ABC transporter periplasmic binding protein [Candidatus Nitrotoga sp. M5]